MMMAVDTNVLARALVEDAAAPAQSAAARAALLAAGNVYVPQIVQVELVWMFDNIMGLSKADILLLLDSLNRNPMYRLQSANLFAVALDEYRSGSADFSDYLILAESNAHGSTLLTYDKKLLKAKGTQRVK